MTRRRFPAPARRSPVGVRHLLALLALVLVAASGTAFTASLDGVPRTSVGGKATSFPTFTTSAVAYDDVAGTTTVRFTVTSSDPDVPPGQVFARVATAAVPDPPFQQCSTTDGSAWSCPVPGLSPQQAADSGTFSSFASP